MDEENKREIYRSMKTLLADGTITQEEFNTTKNVLNLIDFKSRLDLVDRISQFQGRFFSDYWIQKNILPGVQK